MTSLTRHSAPRQESAGAVGGVLLLALVAAGPGLGAVGWFVGLAYPVGLLLLLDRAVRRAGVATLGPAGLVTLARALLVGAVAALVAEWWVAEAWVAESWAAESWAAHGGVDQGWADQGWVAPGAVAQVFAPGTGPVVVLVGLATAALVLDAVDGRVARRTGTVTALGARFDMEVDAFLLLVLSVHVAGLVGPWALGIGLLRYAFVAAGWVAPWLRGALPPRYSAKVVAAAAGVVLVAAASGVLPPPLSAALVAAVLASLTWSFAHDVAWLWRTR